MPKHTQKFFKPTDLFDFKTHWAVGLEYPIEGSKGNSYTVTIADKGFTCDCPGFTFRGKCKHTLDVLTRVETALDDNHPQYRWEYT